MHNNKPKLNGTPKFQFPLQFLLAMPYWGSGGGDLGDGECIIAVYELVMEYDALPDVQTG